jgi:AraC-like DNA-binding protein
MNQFSDMNFALWYGQPSLMDSAHRHNEIEINYLESGAMHYWVGSGRLEIPRQKLLVFWASVPHQLIYLEEQTRFYWLTIPLNYFLHWRMDAQLQEAVLNGEWLFEQNDYPVDALLLNNWLKDYESQVQARKAVMLLEIEARLARLALSLGRITPGNKHPNSHAEAMSKWIAEHYAEPIGVNEVAAAVSLHPNYAMRLFQQNFGRSIVDVLIQHRLAEAQRRLVMTDASVLEIAFDVGFGSLSRFYAVFKERCGQSPKAYREKMWR